MNCKPSPDIILPDDGEGRKLVHLRGHPAGLDVSTVGIEGVSPLAIGSASLDNGFEIGHVAVEDERLERSQIIEETTHAHDVGELVVGQILVEHGEVVAEVEEGFHGVALGQCAASHMIHSALRHTHNGTTQEAEPPTEVDLLVMGKEATVETAHPPIVFGPNHEAGPGGPVYLGHIVILSSVGLDRVENATATERVAVFVEQTARCTCIFKLVAGKHGEQLGLAGSDLRMGIHVAAQRGEPSGRDLHIGVEQHIVVGLDL